MNDNFNSFSREDLLRLTAEGPDIDTKTLTKKEEDKNKDDNKQMSKQDLDNATEDVVLGEEKEKKEAPKNKNNDDLFNYIKETNLMYVPDDFEFDGTDEKLEELYQVDQQYRQKLVEDQFYSQFKDPRLKEMFEYAQQAGEHADLDQFFHLQRQEDNFQTLDPKNPEQAKDIIAKYLQLNGNDDFIVKSALENAEVEGNTEQLATTYKAKIVNAIANQKETEKQRSIDTQKQQRAQQEKFNKNFYNELNMLPKTVQPTLQEQLSMIETEEGNVPLYQAKIQHIYSNPKYFVSLLKFLSTFDPESGFKTQTPEERAKTFAQKTRNFTPKSSSRSYQSQDSQVVDD